ncbi:MAG: DUF6776 family protein [Burkholderiales bacterium]
MAIRVEAKRPVFKPAPYESSSRSRRLPSWLILLLLGIALGGGGVLFLQASYGPKRLSALESQKLTDELSSVTLERQRLQTRVDEISRTVESERAEASQTIKALKDEVVGLKAQIEPMREQIKLFAQSLPYDGKLGPVGISTASFSQVRDGGPLSYLVLLMQERADRPELRGNVEIAVEGKAADGRTQTVQLAPINITLGHYQHVAGQSALPEGFLARRVTVRFMDSTGARPLTWRIFTVQSK